METKKKLPLPLIVLIIGAGIGFVVFAIGLFKQFDAKRINQERYEEAYQIALNNKEILQKKYDEIIKELGTLNSQYSEKTQECSNISLNDPNWFTNKSKCDKEAIEIKTKINELEVSKFQIENYDNTVYYDLVKPMSYQIFYIIGGSIIGAAALGAFIIYLVKGKKTY